MLMNGDTSEEAGMAFRERRSSTYNKSDLYVELFNGSKIHGLPLDDPKKIENYNLGLFWIDQAEEVEEDIFLKFQGRLRQHRAPREGLLTFNPNGHNWLWKRFINPETDPRAWKQELYKCVEATTFDNPNLPQDYFDQFEGLPDHWYQRFVWGSHEVFVGQIFTDFNPEVHVIEPFRIPSDWERWCCIDPGIRHEGCVSWLARDARRATCTTTVRFWRVGSACRLVGATIHGVAEAENDIGGPDEEVYTTSSARKRTAVPDRRKTVSRVFRECGIYGGC
jgi:hypothetical protein